MTRKVLIVDDRLESVAQYVEALEGRGYQVLKSSDAHVALEVFARERPDVVLLDVRMPSRNGLDLLRDMRNKNARVVIIMLSAHGDTSTIVEALKLRADNFADKSYDAEKLLLVVEKELRTKELEAELDGFRASREGRLKTLDDIVGESEAMKAVRRQIMDYADGDLTVFITGESGVGKNVVAEALHTQSKRRRKPFKHLLCTAVQPTLIEAELFGSEKGAYTDATRSKRGLVESAESGTVLLDEIGATTPDVQAKLLLLTETGVYSKVGSEGRSQKTDAWFLTATNIDIPEALKTGRLRQDLFYRLNQAWIHVPPLRERGDDVMLLAEYFIRAEAERTGRPPVALSGKLTDMMMGYPWPGNVRELLSVVRRYVKSGGKDVRIYGGSAEGLDGRGGDGGEPEGDLKAALRREVEAVEKRWITEALQRLGGNRTKAAVRLGISRRNLMYKIKRYGLRE
jgi:two-component system response regulator AtoC